MNRFLLVIFILTTLTSCDNAAKQAEREKFVADSVATSIKQLEQVKTGYSDCLHRLEAEESALQQENAEMAANLTAAKDNLRSVSEFHLLRSSDERQEQIKDASLKVNEIEQEISNLHDRYTEVRDSIGILKEQLASLHR